MRTGFMRQPWETWIVVALGLWCSYLLYLSALHLRIYFNPTITTNAEQFTEALCRVAGLAFMVSGTLVLFLKRRSALVWVGFGVLTYLAPWVYRWYYVSASQPQPHLVWHMVKVYPRLAWQILPLPSVILVFTALAHRRLSANNAFHSDGPRAAREARR